MKSTLLVLGILVFAAGTLFALQGAGIVHWPRESFMLDKRDWMGRGVVVALIGLGLIITSIRIRK